MATCEATHKYHVCKKKLPIVSLVVTGKFGKTSKGLKILLKWERIGILFFTSKVRTPVCDDVTVRSSN